VEAAQRGGPGAGLTTHPPAAWRAFGHLSGLYQWCCMLPALVSLQGEFGVLNMLRVVVVLGLMVGLAGVPAVAPQAASAAAVPEGFVYREGRNLMLDGRPYRFVGFNSFGLTGCATGRPYTQEQMDAYFADLPANGMTRTWAFERWGMDAIDMVVETAERHGQKVILVLTGSGPGGGCETEGKDAAWYASGYQSRYLPWLRRLVERFKDSPAVGMWEIMNEPGHQSTVDAETMKRFLDHAAAEIKQIDPHHLVESGTLAEYTPGTADYAYVHSGPDIDVGSLHEYDYDPAHQLSRHLPRTLSRMYTINKPMIIGEVGIDHAGPGCDVSLEKRDAAFREKFDGYFHSGVAGIMVWNYTPNLVRDCGLNISPQYANGDRPDPVIATVRDYTPPRPVTPPASSGRLAAKHSGRCLDVRDGSTANRAVIQQWGCSSGAHQRFRFEPASDGFYQIVATHSGKCLDVSEQSLALRAALVQWDCWGGANEQFRFEPAGQGYYRLVARHSVQCLALSGASTANGAQLIQYECRNDIANDHFKFRVQS
jgi:mannan endo-1,4-beta-mannosidase